MPNEVVASILASGRVLENASNAAAIISGIGCLFAHPKTAFAAAILCWFVQCYFAIRTRIDASLFLLPLNGLDELLLAWGLVKKVRERSVDERCRAALRLWRF